MFYEQRILTPL